MENHNFVFFDPGGRRKKIFWISLTFILTLLGLVGIATGLTILEIPHLPEISLQAPKLPKLRSVVNDKEAKYSRAKSRLLSLKPRPTTVSLQNVPVTSGQEKRVGFVVNWDDTSFTSLRQNLGKLDVIIPENLHLNRLGNIEIDNPKKEKLITDFIRQNSSKTEIWPLINNYEANSGDWQTDWIDKLLDDPAKQKALIEDLTKYMMSNNYQGLAIDWENLSSNSQKKLPTFLSQLKQVMQLHSWQLAVSVPADNPETEYHQIGLTADWVIVMAYDEHWPGGPSGPVASQNWFVQVINKNLDRIPAEKMIVALANYGYDWPQTGNANDISFQEAIRIAKESQAKIKLDATNLNPTYEYYDENNNLRKVFFTDSITVFNQIHELKKVKIGGIALWRLGSEDPAVWNLWSLQIDLDRTKSQDLEKMEYGFDIDYEGSGEILKVVAAPKEGQRKITFDPESGLINGEEVLSFPSGYVIDRHGLPKEKEVALTFDDGPDAVYTPKILDILKKYGIKATFFVTGDNADKNTNILQRTYKEGHELGNHTFSHPDISAIGYGQLKLELNTTDRLLQSRLGISTLLFRPPYAEDIEPETPEQVKPLMESSQLGYYTVGIGIDPKDWDKTSSTQIIEESLKQLSENRGRVILLHDSGGDRSQTVLALPKLIEALQNSGWKIVPVSTLIGVSPQQIMPMVSSEEKNMLRVDMLGFWLLDLFRFCLYYMFFGGIVLGLGRFLLVSILAVIARLKQSLGKDVGTFTGLVSVIIPAFNEAVVVERTINSVLNSDYKKLEVVAVNDGSTDNTLHVLELCKNKDSRAKVVDKPNSGKAASINLGLQKAKGEIVVIIDADTIFTRKTITKLVSHFSNDEIGAVAGNVKVGNRINWLTKIQSVEYITSQNLDRRAFGLINAITVVPGAIGAWRKDLVLRLGGFATDTLAEDADLTYAILEAGKRVVYEDEALAFTEAPETLNNFIKQRFRWMFGTIQVIYKHIDICFSFRQPGLGWIAIPQVIIFQIIFPILAPLLDLTALVTLSTGWINSHLHSEVFSWTNAVIQLRFYLLFLVLDLVAGVLALILEGEERLWDLGWLFVQRLFFRQIMYVISFKSFLAIIEGKLVGWNKFGRSGKVKLV